MGQFPGRETGLERRYKYEILLLIRQMAMVSDWEQLRRIQNMLYTVALERSEGMEGTKAA